MAAALDSTDMVAEMERIHVTSAVVSAALGRLLTACSMMGNMLKGKEDTITLRMAGNGPVGSIVAVADSHGDVKGYPVNAVVELPLNEKGKLDVSGAIGKEGNLTVIKDLGLKEPYCGTIPLVSGEVAEDITAYYAVSEQIPTVCALGVLVNPDLSIRAAGGFIIQLLPAADDGTIDRLEANINRLKPVTALLEEGKTPLDILNLALDGFSPEVLYTEDVAYRCDCSKERVERALISVGAHELEEMAAAGKDTEVKCHFCDRIYRFTPADLRRLQSK